MGQQKTKIIGMEDLGQVSLEQMKKVGRKRLKTQESPKPRKTPKEIKPSSGAIEQLGQVEVKAETAPTPEGRGPDRSVGIESVGKRPKVGRARVRSHVYKQVLALVDRKKLYGLDEAINLVKKTSYAKFDGTVELHVKTVSKKGQDPVRGLVALPAGAIKTSKVAVASEELISQIEKGKIDFDILLTTPDMMPKLAKVAKILGPKGLMPNPKAGTIAEDPKKAIDEIAKGRVELRQDPLGNIHVAVGKVSWPVEKLKANIQAALQAVASNRLDRISLSATMGPGIRLAKV